MIVFGFLWLSLVFLCFLLFFEFSRFCFLCFVFSQDFIDFLEIYLVFCGFVVFVGIRRFSLVFCGVPWFSLVLHGTRLCIAIFGGPHAMFYALSNLHVALRSFCPKGWSFGRSFGLAVGRTIDRAFSKTDVLTYRRQVPHPQTDERSDGRSDGFMDCRLQERRFKISLSSTHLLNLYYKNNQNQSSFFCCFRFSVVFLGILQFSIVFIGFL